MNMLTPSQIREKKLSTVEEGGYDRGEVNEFLLEVIESYEAVFNENKELYRKMDILANRIEEYRADEDSITKALITAQKTADKMTKEAEAQAELTISESRESAQKTVSDAQEKADGIVAEARDYVARITQEKTESANEIIAEAEKKANEAINGAKVVAQNALTQAKALANKIVSDAKSENDYYTSMNEKLQAEGAQFRTALITLYESQLSKLSDIQSFSSDTEAEE
ncbi:MAG: DivIVA domain-containing protein, partial [Eubacterium sp.]|nr:DivIVA domain-containing protein [Eubacterium sp.]